jgi:ubiquinone/menaquinone biosynthesis C-methylase UbiE
MQKIARRLRQIIYKNLFSTPKTEYILHLKLTNRHSHNTTKNTSYKSRYKYLFSPIRKESQIYTSLKTTTMATKPEPDFGAKHFDRVASNYESPDPKSRMAKIARELIAMAPAITSSSIIHDNASGPGILASEIVDQFLASEGGEEKEGKPEIHATDISPGMISVLQAKERLTKFGIKSEVMDSCSLSFPDEKFTHSLTNMGIFLFPSPEKGAREIYRTLKFAGTAVVTSVGKVGWVEVVQAAQKTVRPDVSEENGELWFGPLDKAWITKGKLVEVLVEGGFSAEKIEVREMREKQSMKVLEAFLYVCPSITFDCQLVVVLMILF